MERGRQNFLSFWAIFCPFTPLKPPKIMCPMLHKCSKNHDHMPYCSDKVCDRCNFHFHFWLFFEFLPPLNPKNQFF